MTKGGEVRNGELQLQDSVCRHGWLHYAFGAATSDICWDAVQERTC